MKKFLAILLVLMMTLACSVPTFAAYDYDRIYDATELLDYDYCVSMGEEVLPELTEQYGVDLRIDLVRDLEDETIEDYADIFYDQYEYGLGDNKEGLHLMIYAVDNGNDLIFYDYTLNARGAAAEAIAAAVDSTLAVYLSADIWADGLDMDNAAFMGAVQELVSVYEIYFDPSKAPAPAEEPAVDEPAAEEPATFADYVPFPEYDNGIPYCVTDLADILTPEEEGELESLASTASANTDFGIYVVTLPDYTLYGGGSIHDVAVSIYDGYNFGVGDTKDGIILILSMADRDFNVITGGFGEEAFTPYGKEYLSEYFLDNFADDDWVGGFTDYINTAEDMVIQAQNGEPVEAYSDGMVLVVGILVSLILGAIIAFVVVRILKRQLISVMGASEANDYMTEGGIKITDRQDHYVRTDVSRVYDPPKESSHSSSGGHSSHSGKF